MVRGRHGRHQTVLGTELTLDSALSPLPQLIRIRYQLSAGVWVGRLVGGVSEQVFKGISSGEISKSKVQSPVHIYNI